MRPARRAARAARPRRLLHTSDIHLGCDYSGELARQALRAVVDLGRACRADAMPLAGDILDHNRVPDSEVSFLIEQLACFDAPSVILPGNHDCYDAGSVYRIVYLVSGDRIDFLQARYHY